MKITREAKRITLSMYHRLEARAENIRVKRFLPYFTETVVENGPLTITDKSICFVITRMVRFHGGQTSILRLGTELAVLGWKVSYADMKPQSRQEMELCGRSNLRYVKGEFIPREELSERRFDVVVASSWDTVSLVKEMQGYRMYFVQDYEPYFYPFGELFFMAEKTYEQGLHMVSLGDWNKRIIERDCRLRSPVDRIDFPYERRDYHSDVKRDYKSYRDKKKITIAVYLKFYGKRLPTLIPYLVQDLKKYMAERGREVEILYYGEARSFKSPGGRNLGMLTREQLLDLYSRADFGMVASMSNISLVPYEMLACGLPVIEFEGGTFNDFFPEGSCIMTNFSSERLCSEVSRHLENPELIEREMETAGRYMAGLSWQKSAAQFDQIIENTRAQYESGTE